MMEEFTTFEKEMKSYSEFLTAENVEWHSKNGRWGSINRSLMIIEENGGPDFLANEFI